jgi:hypothetical protein
MAVLDAHTRRPVRRLRVSTHRARRDGFDRLEVSRNDWPGTRPNTDPEVNDRSLWEDLYVQLRVEEAVEYRSDRRYDL